MGNSYKKDNIKCHVEIINKNDIKGNLKDFNFKTENSKKFLLTNYHVLDFNLDHKIYFWEKYNKNNSGISFEFEETTNSVSINNLNKKNNVW